MASEDLSYLFQTPYHTEQEWIISSVCRNAFEILAFDKDKKGELVSPAQVTLKILPGDELAYDVTIHGATTTVEAKLQWPGSIWSPAAYVPFCQAAAQALKLGPPASADARGNPLHALLDFSEAAIEAENLRISQWLTAQPDNAAANEQAALLLVIFAQKESSGQFYDPRGALNHACAHLAVAQFLRAGSLLSEEGRMAACLIGVITHTQVQTGRELDRFSKEKSVSPDLSSWLNAARVRNTLDWRIIKNPETATPLEQIAYFSAVVHSINTDQAIKWLKVNSIPDRPDWTRMVLQGGFTVESGHVFARPSVDMELHTMQTTFPGSFQGSGLVDDLNRPPGDVLGVDGPEAGRLIVINRGMWAQFFQRHLCDAIFQTGFFLANMWGVPEDALQLDQDVEKNYSGLTLYPKLQFDNWRFRQKPVDSAMLLAFFAAHPEWGDYRWREKAMSPDDAWERLERLAFQWFSPPIPQGTDYDVGDRLDGWAMTPADIDKYYAIAPLEPKAAEAELVVSTHNDFSFAQYQKINGALLDFNVSVMKEARHANDITFDERLQLGEKSAALDPEELWLLAYDCVKAGRDKEAADVYQQYFDEGTDRVSVSNCMDWLVNYYYDHGQKDKAMAIAQSCADVGSGLGMQTMMRLLEKMGRLDEAEQYGQQIVERYDESGPLAAFYKRQADKGDAGYKAKFDALASKVFAQGLNKVELAALSDPPTLGMTFSDTSADMRSNGLSSDQIVVALDGYGIQNKEQFIFVWSLSDLPTMQLIVWDGHAYREITAKLADRNFGVMYLDYHR